jgi:hypothetical protein
MEVMDGFRFGIGLVAGIIFTVGVLSMTLLVVGIMMQDRD